MTECRVSLGLDELRKMSVMPTVLENRLIFGWNICIFNVILKACNKKYICGKILSVLIKGLISTVLQTISNFLPE